MQKIVPHLWFDNQARQAAAFYTGIFPDSKITNTTTLHNTPSGDCDVVSFDLWGTSFMAISAGPVFKFNPSISFMVNFDLSRDPQAREKLDSVWEQLSQGGSALMPLDKYPFSQRYGWIQDKYGLTWQLILTSPEGEPRPPIVPAMLFVNGLYGKAHEATDFYLSVFKNSKRGTLFKYPAGAEPNTVGAVMFTDFRIEGQWLCAMDGAGNHEFSFNEAVSLLVNCDTQEEIDYYWEKLSAVPEAEQCGWLKDKYGVVWQISPAEMNTMISGGNQEKIDNVTRAFLPMKKLDLEKLREAFNQ